MGQTSGSYILRNRIKNLFETYEEYLHVSSKENNNSPLFRGDGNILKVKGNNDDYKLPGPRGWPGSSSVDPALCPGLHEMKESTPYEKENDFWRNLGKGSDANCVYNNHCYNKCISRSILVKECLLVENYTSLIYENCEEKINVLVANKGLPEGIIEAQIKGKDSFLIRCSYFKNIISFFSPQLEVGAYTLTFFLNKEIVYVKLLRDSVDTEKRYKCVPFHVIAITDFGNSVINRTRSSLSKKKRFELSTTNNVHTNKELLKIYNSVCKEYGNRENGRNSQIMVGYNFKLKNTSDMDFYSLFKNYKDQFIDHTFEKNCIKTDDVTYDRNKNVINNINFVGPFNFEPFVAQNRIPILYKKLLYDNCTYENKKILMQFHNNLFELDPFEVLSVHIFTKEDLKDGYSIFAFNLIPLAKNAKQLSANETFLNASKLLRRNGEIKDTTDMSAFEKKHGAIGSDAVGSINKINMNVYNKSNYSITEKTEGYKSSLYMLQSDETNCADIRLWKHLDTFTCRKNRKAADFYIKKQECCTNIQSPVPPDLINNKNVFKKYAEGIKISDNISIFFESWNEDVMPIKKFIDSFIVDVPLKKIQHVCSLIKGVKEDYFLFDESFNKSDCDGVPKKGSDGNNNDHPAPNKVEKQEQGNINKSEQKTGQATEEGKSRENGDGKNTSRKEIMDHLLNNFVSFTLIVDGKIYNSVIPISKFLLFFIINCWLHFVDVRKQLV